MAIALAIVLLLVALAIVFFGVAIILAPADDRATVLESRARTNPTGWIRRPLRTDARRLAAPAFADR